MRTLTWKIAQRGNSIMMLSADTSDSMYLISRLIGDVETLLIRGWEGAKILVIHC